MAAKAKHFIVVEPTTYRGRTVNPKIGDKPAFGVTVTPNEKGKTPFDKHPCWKEVPVSREQKVEPSKDK